MVAFLVACVVLWPFAFVVPGFDVQPQRYVHMWELTALLASAGVVSGLVSRAPCWEQCLITRVTTMRLAVITIVTVGLVMMPLIAWLILDVAFAAFPQLVSAWGELGESYAGTEGFTFAHAFRFAVFTAHVFSVMVLAAGLGHRLAPVVLACSYPVLLSFQAYEHVAAVLVIPVGDAPSVASVVAASGLVIMSILCYTTRRPNPH